MLATCAKARGLSMTAEQICLMKAAEFNCQRCYEFMIMNGAKEDHNTLIGGFKDSNGAIIKHCLNDFGVWKMVGHDALNWGF